MYSRSGEDLPRPGQVAVVGADVPHDGIATYDRHFVARHLSRTDADANGRTAVDIGLAYEVQNLATSPVGSEPRRE